MLASAPDAEQIPALNTILQIVDKNSTHTDLAKSVKATTLLAVLEDVPKANANKDIKKSWSKSLPRHEDDSTLPLSQEWKSFVLCQLRAKVPI